MRRPDEFALLGRFLAQRHLHGRRSQEPSRNLPLSLALGTILVISLYLLANLAYLAVLSFSDIQNAPEDRVASQAMEAIFKGGGAKIMAAAIMVSTFGCNKD